MDSPAGGGTPPGFTYSTWNNSLADDDDWEDGSDQSSVRSRVQPTSPIVRMVSIESALSSKLSSLSSKLAEDQNTERIQRAEYNYRSRLKSGSAPHAASPASSTAAPASAASSEATSPVYRVEAKANGGFRVQQSAVAKVVDKKHATSNGRDSTPYRAAAIAAAIQKWDAPSWEAPSPGLPPPGSAARPPPPPSLSPLPHLREFAPSQAPPRSPPRGARLTVALPPPPPSPPHPTRSPYTTPPRAATPPPSPKQAPPPTLLAALNTRAPAPGSAPVTPPLSPKPAAASCPQLGQAAVSSSTAPPATPTSRLARAAAVYPRLRMAVLVGLAAAAVAGFYSMSLVLSLDTCQRVGVSHVSRLGELEEQLSHSSSTSSSCGAELASLRSEMSALRALTAGGSKGKPSTLPVVRVDTSSVALPVARRLSVWTIPPPPKPPPRRGAKPASFAVEVATGRHTSAASVVETRAVPVEERDGDGLIASLAKSLAKSFAGSCTDGAQLGRGGASAAGQRAVELERVDEGAAEEMQGAEQTAVERVVLTAERLAWDAAVEAELAAVARATPPPRSLRAAVTLLLRHAALVLSGAVALLALLCMGHIGAKVEMMTPRRATPRVGKLPPHELPFNDAAVSRRLAFTEAAAGAELRLAGLPKWPTRRRNPGRRPPQPGTPDAQRTPSTYRGDVTSSITLAADAAALSPWWPALW